MEFDDIWTWSFICGIIWLIAQVIKARGKRKAEARIWAEGGPKALHIARVRHEAQHQGFTYEEYVDFLIYNSRPGSVPQYLIDACRGRQPSISAPVEEDDPRERHIHDPNYNPGNSYGGLFDGGRSWGDSGAGRRARHPDDTSSTRTSSLQRHRHSNM